MCEKSSFRKAITILFTLALLGFSQTEARANVGASGFTPVNDKPFMELVGSVEGPDGYDAVNLGVSRRPPRPLSTMSVGEVLSYQRRLLAEGSGFTAAGRYQFIHKTLKALVARHGVNLNARFDRVMQDYLARRMMHDCAFYEVNKPRAEIGNCLARAWAALPVIYGVKAGRSYYDGLAGNRALVSREQVLEALSKRFAPGGAPQVISYRRTEPYQFPKDGKIADRIPLAANP